MMVKMESVVRRKKNIIENLINLITGQKSAVDLLCA